jgi:hypothetical protein
MKASSRLTRRRLGELLAGLITSAWSPAIAAPDKPKDNGIGGTGSVWAMPEPSDNGIGGTGVIGTIQDFGSIIVNGVHVSYPTDALIAIDGEQSEPSQMKIGQVASLVAEKKDQDYVTSRIEIIHEVIGEIETVSGRTLRLVGQKVELGPGIKAPALKAGLRVAISGLRLPDQTIVASLIEAAGSGQEQLVGTVTRAPDGNLMIGGQAVSNVATSYLGQRVILRGSSRSKLFEASYTSNNVRLPRGVERFLVETYLERRGATVTTADGLILPMAREMKFQGVVRAVVGLDLSNGGWSVQSFHPSQRLGTHGAADSSQGSVKSPSGSSEPAGPTNDVGSTPPVFNNPVMPGDISGTSGPGGSGPPSPPMGPGRPPGGFGGPGGGGHPP